MSNAANTADAAPAVGRVSDVRGPLVEIRFDGGAAALANVLPFDALTVADSLTGQTWITLTVIQKRSNGTVRCLNTTPEQSIGVGTIAYATGVWRKDLTDTALLAAVQVARGNRSAASSVLETGIKAIDFLCPLCPGGVAGIFGGTGVGSSVLTGELRHRLGATGQELSLALMTRRTDLDATRDMRLKDTETMGEFDDQGSVQTFYLLTENATDPYFIDESALPSFDAALFLSPLHAARGHYPPVDAMYSRSRMLDPQYIGREHADTYERYMDAAVRVKDLMFDPTFMELMALRAQRRALTRFYEVEQERPPRLSPNDARLVARVRRVEKFLTQPYYVTEPYTGMPGRTVPRAATVAAVKAILDGAYDHLPERAFFFIGDISEYRQDD